MKALYGMFTVYCPHRLHNNVIDISFSFGVSSPPRLLKDFSKLERVPIINIRYAPDHFQISKLFALKVSLIFQCPPFYLEGKNTLCCLHCLVRCNRKNIATSFHSFCFFIIILTKSCSKMAVCGFHVRMSCQKKILQAIIMPPAIKYSLP